MHTHEERFAEMPTTTIGFVRIRVTLDLPHAPHQLTSAMHIPESMYQDMKRVHEARAALDSSLGKLDEKTFRHNQIVLRDAEERASHARNAIAAQISHSLMRAIGPDS